MGKTICEYYSNVTAKPVDWLWYPYIPYGKLTVIQGDPGEGKSTFVLNLVSLLTNGQKMPDGYRLPGPGVAIYQCAEDGMADTIKPRLMKAGANCDRVAYIIDDESKRPEPLPLLLIPYRLLFLRMLTCKALLKCVLSCAS